MEYWGWVEYMKFCCGNGKLISEMDELEKLSCNHDHCTGPKEVDSLDLLLYSCGKFDPKDGVSSEDLAKLVSNNKSSTGAVK